MLWLKLAAELGSTYLVFPVVPTTAVPQQWPPSCLWEPVHLIPLSLLSGLQSFWLLLL